MNCHGSARRRQMSGGACWRRFGRTLTLPSARPTCVAGHRAPARPALARQTCPTCTTGQSCRGSRQLACYAGSARRRDTAAGPVQARHPLRLRHCSVSATAPPPLRHRHRSATAPPPLRHRSVTAPSPPSRSRLPQPPPGFGAPDLHNTTRRPRRGGPADSCTTTVHESARLGRWRSIVVLSTSGQPRPTLGASRWNRDLSARPPHRDRTHGCPPHRRHRRSNPAHPTHATQLARSCSRSETNVPCSVAGSGSSVPIPSATPPTVVDQSL